MVTDVVNKLKKLTELSRREFMLRGSAAAGAPKIPGKGLQGLVKALPFPSSSFPVDIEDLYKLQTKLKSRIIEYLGSTLGSSPGVPGGFEGIQHTLDSPEAREAGKKYWKLLMKQLRELTDKMESGDISFKDSLGKTQVSLGEPEVSLGEKREVRSQGKRLSIPHSSSVKEFTKQNTIDPWRQMSPQHVVGRPTEFKTWQDVQKDYRDIVLKQREKALGTTLITRSAGAGKTLPIGSPLPEALPSKPAPKKLEGPKTERTTRPEEPEKTTKPKKPVEPKRTLEPRITRTASPKPQLPSGRDLSRIALRGAATAAGWPLYAASFGIPSARSGESQVLAELADQPGADVDAALRNYRQRLAQEQQELDLRGELVMSGMP